MISKFSLFKMTILHESVLCESDGPETNETHSGDIHHRLELCVGLQLDVLDCHDVWSEAGSLFGVFSMCRNLSLYVYIYVL